MGKTGKKAAVKTAQSATEAFNKLAFEFVGKQKELGGPIEQLAKMLIEFGIDPAKFLASPQGQALLAPLQQATAKNFEGARVSLADQMAGSGINNASPFGNLLSEEAGAQSQNVLAMIGQALGLGQAGAGLLTGQQQIFNPFNPAQIALGYNRNIFGNDPSQTLDIVKTALGALGTAATGGFGSTVGGLFGKPK